ncbi:MAG: hypothetical protein ACI89X_003864 [Planctomycetota bacterium]|jgi:hypothetical protein
MKLLFDENLGVGNSSCGSDHPNPTQPQSHPNDTRSTHPFHSDPTGHSTRLRRKRRLLAAIQDPDSIERELRAMGLSFDVPELAPARAPPGGEQEWFGA